MSIIWCVVILNLTVDKFPADEISYQRVSASSVLKENDEAYLVCPACRQACSTIPADQEAELVWRSSHIAQIGSGGSRVAVLIFVNQ